MDYSKITDITVDRFGMSTNRRWIPSGKKVVIKCVNCSGYVIQYCEDSLIVCKHHFPPAIVVEEYSDKYKIRNNTIKYIFGFISMGFVYVMYKWFWKC